MDIKNEEARCTRVFPASKCVKMKIEMVNIEIMAHQIEYAFLLCYLHSWKDGDFNSELRETTSESEFPDAWERFPPNRIFWKNTIPTRLFNSCVSQSMKGSFWLNSCHNVPFIL